MEATEAAQLAAIDFGKQLADLRMEFWPAWKYWEERPIGENSESFIVDTWNRCKDKEYFVVYFCPTDSNTSGGDLIVFVGKDPIEVLGVIGGS